MCRGQNHLQELLPPSTVWILGIELKWSGLAASPCTL